MVKKLSGRKRTLWKQMVYDEIQFPDKIIGVITFRQGEDSERIIQKLCQLILDTSVIRQFSGINLPDDRRIASMFIDHIIGKVVYHVSDKMIMFEMKGKRADDNEKRGWFVKNILSELFFSDKTFKEIRDNLTYSEKIYLKIGYKNSCR